MVLERVQRRDAIAGKIVKGRVGVATAGFAAAAAVKDQDADTDRRETLGQLLVESVVARRRLRTPEDDDHGHAVAVLRQVQSTSELDACVAEIERLLRDDGDGAGLPRRGRGLRPQRRSEAAGDRYQTQE